MEELEYGLLDFIECVVLIGIGSYKMFCGKHLFWWGFLIAYAIFKLVYISIYLKKRRKKYADA